MQVVEIDDIDAEALEARVARPPGVVRRAVNAARRATRVAQYAELGREHNRVAPLADDATHQFLVVPSPVGVRGIEKGDAEFKGAKQRQARLVIVRQSVACDMPMHPSPMADTCSPLRSQAAAVCVPAPFAGRSFVEARLMASMQWRAPPAAASSLDSIAGT